MVDSCLERAENVTSHLLRRWEAERIRLAGLTHPEADHYRGFSDLVNDVRPDHIWTFPYLCHRRTLLASLARCHPRDGRWRELSAALASIDEAMSANRAAPVYSLQHLTVGDVRLSCIAPCPADLVCDGRRLERLLVKIVEGASLTDEEGHLLRGTKLDGSGNGLSLALVVDWGQLRICLGGDVEVFPEDPSRGWNGAKSYLEAEGSGALLDNVTLVKVAHHGSDRAFSSEVYMRHALNRPPVAVITPFAGGTNPPPHSLTLRELRRHCSRLGVTTAPVPDWTHISEAGWAEISRPDDPSACCVVASCQPDGNVSLSAHGAARVFV